MTITFIFADGESRRHFDSTFDAYEEVLNAYNMCEEYFVGVRLATTKRPIDILEAERYLRQVGPVKDYLEYAAVCGFDDEQIVEDINSLYGIYAHGVLSSWKTHMREYMDVLERFMI